MKKSTLITTIAMIVVVVVALSTATYAWFSSSATAVASTNFTTNASGDWSMIVGVATPTSASAGTLVFDGAAVDTATLAKTPIQKGLWAPTAAIATTIAKPDSSTTIANPAGFVSADKGGTAVAPVYSINALQTATFNSAKEGGAAAENGLPAPFALRVMNVSGKEKTLQLNITLNAKNTGLTNSMFAAAAVRFYVYELSNNGGENGTGATYTSGYYPIASAETATVNAKTAVDGTITQGSQVNMTAGLSGTYLDDNAPTTAAVEIASYSVANIASNFTKATGANDNLGIAENDYVRTYTFDMQTYAIGGWSNIIIYAWIDGWVANGSAASANFDVNFGFTSVPTAASSNAQEP